MLHKAGFVSVIGLPNAGKSTLNNALAGIDLSIVNPKPQTTRHRILSIVSGKDYQIVLSDAPGYIKDPKYKLQENMNRFVHSVFEDSDICMIVQDSKEAQLLGPEIIKQINAFEGPKILVLNKIDLANEDQLRLLTKQWSERIAPDHIIRTDALKKIGIDQLLQLLIDHLPYSPPYYPKDQLSDRSYRFFVSEMIREKIMELYQDEIPYSVQVIVTEYQETKTKTGEDLVRIYASIIVMRDTQKAILLGKAGKSIKKLGILARKSIEKFIGKKVYLELTIKVKKNWRNDERMLKYFGY